MGQSISKEEEKRESSLIDFSSLQLYIVSMKTCIRTMYEPMKCKLEAADETHKLTTKTRNSIPRHQAMKNKGNLKDKLVNQLNLNYKKFT
jgi:hypothetical protein